MEGNPLDRDAIGDLITGSPPLVERYLSLETQLQPNGFDLSLATVSRPVTAGSMGSDPDERELSDLEPLAFGPDGWLRLDPGPYVIDFNEVLNLPLNVTALGHPRSSLPRSGVSIQTAVWDAGFHGRSQSLLVVHHPAGYRLRRAARLLQLIFFRLPRATSQGYQGRFQEENLA